MTTKCEHDGIELPFDPYLGVSEYKCKKCDKKYFIPEERGVTIINSKYPNEIIEEVHLFIDDAMNQITSIMSDLYMKISDIKREK